MRQTLIKDLGKKSATAAFFSRISPTEPDVNRIRAAVPELAAAVRAGDREAVLELREILLGSRKYPPAIRDALLAEIGQNEEIRGILELYQERQRTASQNTSMYFIAPPVPSPEEIFAKTVSSLLNAPQVRLDGLQGVEAEFFRSFLSRPILKRGEADASGRRVLAFRETSEHFGKIKGDLSEFLESNPSLSDGFFDVIHQLAIRYTALAPGHCERNVCSDYAMPHMQLSILLNDPRLLSDARLDRSLEVIAEMRYDQPIHFNQHVQYIGDKYVLCPNILSSISATVERLAANPRLWKGEMGRVFMSSLAEAVGQLSESDPEGTRRARTILLMMAVTLRDDDSADVRYHLVYTFKTESDIVYLRSLKDNCLAHPMLRAEVEKILSGEYEDTLWAI